mgnify:CR=1 FL=1
MKETEAVVVDGNLSFVHVVRFLKPIESGVVVEVFFVLVFKNFVVFN